jgi:hypothetical protein
VAKLSAPATRIVTAAAPTGTRQPRRFDVTDRVTSGSSGGDGGCPPELDCRGERVIDQFRTAITRHDVPPASSPSPRTVALIDSLGVPRASQPQVRT